MDKVISHVNKNDTQSILKYLPTSLQSLAADTSNHQNNHQQLLNLTVSLKESTLSPTDLIKIYTVILDHLSSNRALLFEQHTSQIREHLASQYESQQEYTQAAQCLRAIPLESTQRQIPLLYKMQINNWIVRLFLEDEDSVQAETYLNRMAGGMHECNDLVLNLQFKASQARVLDYKRQFFPAAHKYMELSMVKEMDESEQIDAIEKALICIILGGAGPQRTRLLAQLYADDRLRTHPSFQKNSLYAILESTFLERLLPTKQVVDFCSVLSPHHLARLADGSTVIERSVTEHNIFAASKLYLNIGFERLGELLGVDKDKAENAVAKMIIEKRLKGHIDQVGELVVFGDEEDLDVEEKDQSILAVCQQLDVMYECIATKYPEWIEQFER